MMDDARLQQLLAAYRLKDETRTGWELRDVERPESVAAHSWGVAFLTLLYGPETGKDINLHRALKMAVLHDVAEAWTGDHLTRADDTGAVTQPDGKNMEERRAMEQFAETASFPDIMELWEAYSAKQTPESRFVKDMDLIDMVLQAYLYEIRDRYDPDADNSPFDEYEHMDEFFATTEPRLTTDTGKTLFDTIRSAYEEAKQG